MQHGRQECRPSDPPTERRHSCLRWRSPKGITVPPRGRHPTASLRIGLGQRLESRLNLSAARLEERRQRKFFPKLIEGLVRRKPGFISRQLK